MIALVPPLLALILSSPLPPSRPGERVHRVLKGESWQSLSLKYLEREEQAPLLALYNHLPPGGRLLPKRKIRIPLGVRVKVRKGETWKKLASRHLGDPRLASCLAAVNGRPPKGRPRPGESLWVPPLVRYEVEAGDELGGIAERYLGKIEYFPLIEACSNLDDPNTLEKGMALLLPAGPLPPPPRIPPALPSEAAPSGTRPSGGTRTSPVGATASVRLPGKATEPPAVSTPPADRETLELALRWYEEGSFERSRRLLEKLLEGKSGRRLAPADRERARLVLATDQVALGDESDARETCAALLKDDPSFRPDPVEVSPKVREVFDAARQEGGDAHPR